MNDSMSTECLAWIQRPQYWDMGRSRVAHPLPCGADSKWGTLGTKDSKARHLQPGNSRKEGRTCWRRGCRQGSTLAEDDPGAVRK